MTKRKQIRKYTVTREGTGWGVVDQTGTLINDVPLTQDQAYTLANDCNFPRYTKPTDELPEGD
jgi:hypothetical protein